MSSVLIASSSARARENTAACRVAPICSRPAATHSSTSGDASLLKANCEKPPLAICAW